MNLAIDIFGNQGLNIDKSGRGDLKIFRENLAKFAKDAKVTILECDSGSVTEAFIVQFIEEYGAISIFSIDGSHTAASTYCDIVLAEKFCQNGSIILLDDYYLADWPGVHEGFLRYLFFSANKFCPLFYANNKMFLCGRTYFNIWEKNFINFIKKDYNLSVKEVSLAGYKFYSLHYLSDSKPVTTASGDLQSLSKKYEKEIAELTLNRNDLLQKNRLLSEELAGVYKSRSWRVTAPLRFGAGLFRHKKKSRD